MTFLQCLQISNGILTPAGFLSEIHWDFHLATIKPSFLLFFFFLNLLFLWWSSAYLLTEKKKLPLFHMALLFYICTLRHITPINTSFPHTETLYCTLRCSLFAWTSSEQSRFWCRCHHVFLPRVLVQHWFNTASSLAACLRQYNLPCVCLAGGEPYHPVAHVDYFVLGSWLWFILSQWKKKKMQYFVDVTFTFPSAICTPSTERRDSSFRSSSAGCYLR